jgi:S-adenosylmethionine:tRNA ribosyltransferase-isomerase
MIVSDFDYDLPDRLIAKQPPVERGGARLLVLDRVSGAVQDRQYADLADLLNAGDVLVLNDTKVIKARLEAVKPNGARRELIVLERHAGDSDWHRHKVLHRGRLAVGDKLRMAQHELTVDEVLGGGVAVVSSPTDLMKLDDEFGAPPLPPYLKRQATADDLERYQTVFANQPGSAAAPTASLNMTNDLLNRLSKKGVIVKYLTLHVGLGTFLPIRSDQVENHPIHSEYFEIPVDTHQAIQTAKAANRRIIAVGTTVARTLEYVASSLRAPSPVSLRGAKRRSNPEELCLDCFGDKSPRNDNLAGEADIYIYPSYKFQIINALLTNFHAPRSTVLLLAAAFADPQNLKSAYAHAKTQKYRFLSYGDSMLIS